MTKTAAEVMQDDFLNKPRRSAQYDAAFDARMAQFGLGKNQEPTDAQFEKCRQAGEEADRRAVFGFDYQRDPKTGEPMEQGIGSVNNPSLNSFNALLANERRGLEAPGAYQNAVKNFWRDYPEKAKKIGLPVLPRATTTA